MITRLALIMALLLPMPYAERIAEDDPRWDCHTMGNHTCGQALDIDWSHIDDLRN